MRPRGPQLRDVRRGDAADGDDGDGDRPRDGRDACRSNRIGQSILCGGGKGRPYSEVAGTLGHEPCRPGGFPGSAADDVVRAGDAPRRGHRQVVGAKVGAVRPDRQRDVDPALCPRLKLAERPLPSGGMAI